MSVITIFVKIIQHALETGVLSSVCVWRDITGNCVASTTTAGTSHVKMAEHVTHFRTGASSVCVRPDTAASRVRSMTLARPILVNMTVHAGRRAIRRLRVIASPRNTDLRVNLSTDAI